ncbi:MAG: hypothetical protein PHE17_19630 [Thiothrix sp.]|uniref:hypothetical protein n=1 Tax=Thiothrix sp. TaxID=1032 RepID=UPI002635F50B|nr:hypothetical protein [Thiothrix sp.]MDD5395240.1 hypothetical protein [Thiothrix sp.]
MAIVKLSEKNKVLHFQREVTEGTEVAQTATSVILTQNLQATIGEGDTQTDEYDGTAGRDNPVSTGNMRNSFAFDMPVTLSGTAGTAPALGAVLQACGFKETITAATSVKYTPEALGAIKSGSVTMRRDLGTGFDLWYKTKAAKGILGIEIKAGQRPKFKVSNLVGDYIEPLRSANGTISPTNYGTQKTLVCDTASPDSVVTATLNGKALCLDSFSCQNLSGLDLQRFTSMCTGFTVANPATPEATMTAVMPDWSADFNPFQYGRTDGAVKRYALVIDLGTVAGKKVRLEVAECQPVNPKESSLTGGVLGFEMGLRLLSDVQITFS